jgi:hypothetical protein
MNQRDLNKHRRLVVTPHSSNPRLPSTVLNVECAEDEDVEWQWTQTAQGRFVSGYVIVPRPIKTPRLKPNRSRTA